MNIQADIKFEIKEHSWVARVAARKLKEESVAIVLGNTIHLFGVSKENFLKNERWIRHEAEHIRQFQQYGFLPFIWKYLAESMRKGYYNNKFEVAARDAERPKM